MKLSNCENKIKEVVAIESKGTKWSIFNCNNMDYNVSSKGKIISVATGRIIKERLNRDGYPVVTLGVNSKRVTRYVHRLMAELFIPNEFNLPEVNHKDFDRTNYSIENLEWCTHADNVTYSAKNGRHVSLKGELNPNYNNKTLHIKYKNNPALSKEKQSRPAGKNGRAIKVELYDKDMNFIQDFDFIGGCAEYLINNNYTKAKATSIAVNIGKSIKSNKVYLKHYFKDKK